MPTYIDIEPALLRWQAKYGQRLTNEELAERAGISIATLYRMKSGDVQQPNLNKINAICKVLECEPGEIIVRQPTKPVDELTRLEVERIDILREMDAKYKRRQNQRRAKDAGSETVQATSSS